MPYQQEDCRYYFQTRIVPHTEWEGYTVIYLDPDLVPVLPLKQFPKLRVDGDVQGNYLGGAFVPSKSGWFMYMSKATLKSISAHLGDLIEFSFRIADQDAVDAPVELMEVLDKDPQLKSKWETLTPGKRRGLSHRVTIAKTEAIKQKRIKEFFTLLDT